MSTNNNNDDAKRARDATGANATAGSGKKNPSKPETIPADEPSSRYNQIIKEEEKEGIEDDTDTADEKPRPETVSVREPPNPAYHRTDGQDSEEEKQEIVSADFEGEGWRMSSSGGRTAVREMMALQEGGMSPGKEARANVDSPDFRITAESPPQDEAEDVAAVPASPSSSSNVRPGAVAVPGPGADSHGTTQRSRDTSSANRDVEAGGDGDPDVIIVAAEAYAVEEDDTDDAPMATAMATVVKRKTICGIDRAHFGWMLAVIGIVAAVIFGVMAGTGSDPPYAPTTSSTSDPTIESTPDGASVPVPPTAIPTVSPFISPTITPMPTECEAPSTKLLPDDGAAYSWFGRSVSLYGNTAFIGASGDNDNGSFSGSAYIFIRTGTTWSQQAKLLPDDGAADDYFGYSVSLHRDTAIIGATGGGDRSGSAYVFTRTGTTWEQQAKLLPDDGAKRDRFGWSVSLYGDTAIVGAHWDDDNGDYSGSAYIFIRTGTMWTQQAKLLPDDGAAFNNFGTSMSLYGNTVIVGGSGSAYVFIRTGTTWTQQAKLLPDDWGVVRFGLSVSLDGDTAIVGAAYDDDNGEESGSAYIFIRTGTTWVQQAKLLPDDGAAGDYFGRSVSLDGSSAVIGASHFDTDGGRSVYVFTRSGTKWSQQKELLPDERAGGDGFGYSVAVNGTTVFVGSFRDADNGSDSGSAYAFELC